LLSAGDDDYDETKKKINHKKSNDFFYKSASVNNTFIKRGLYKKKIFIYIIFGFFNFFCNESSIRQLSWSSTGVLFVFFWVDMTDMR
jgi:hypothetical protein